MSELTDFLNEFKRQNSLQNQVLKFFLEQQIKQAAQTPLMSPPITWNLKCASNQAIQVLPRNESRYKVGIANFGPSDIIYSTMHFKPLEILNHLVDPSNPNPLSIGYNQAVQIGFLSAGTNIDINSVQAIWAYNIDSAYSDATNVNAIISLQDSLYQSHFDPTAMPATQAREAWKQDTQHESLRVGGLN